MEDTGTNLAKKVEDHVPSAAAFVAGGIQDACDDACSICLEAFTESDPSTVTSCKHEFHLQCVLEWCQRSSQCPMCWQSITMKDPTSQELLEVVEQERNFRLTPPRRATIFHHPTLGDFELQHLPVGANDSELQEHIIQHLAAAAAMGRARHMSRREGYRSRPSAHGHPRFLVFSSHPNVPRIGTHPSTLSLVGEESEPAVIAVASPASPISTTGFESPQQNSQFSSAETGQISGSTSVSTVVPTNQHIYFHNRQSSMPSPDISGPSELQSFSESLKSRFNAMSLRYKESISKSTRGWKERLFSRTASINESGSDSRGEVNGGSARAPGFGEGFEARETGGTGHEAASDHAAVRRLSNPSNAEFCDGCSSSVGETSASYATSSVSN